MSQAVTVSDDNNSDLENFPSLPCSRRSESVVGTAASHAINVDGSGFSDSDLDGENYSIAPSKQSRAISPPSPAQEPQQPLRSEIQKIPSNPTTGFATLSAQNQHTGSTGTSTSFIPLDAASVRRGIQEGGSANSRTARPKNGTCHEHQCYLLILTVLISGNICLRGDSLLPAP
jgi:hypothetical protein